MGTKCNVWNYWNGGQFRFSNSDGLRFKDNLNCPNLLTRILLVLSRISIVRISKVHWLLFSRVSTVNCPKSKSRLLLSQLSGWRIPNNLIPLYESQLSESNFFSRLSIVQSHYPNLNHPNLFLFRISIVRISVPELQILCISNFFK